MFKVTILTLLCCFLAGSDTGELGVKIERNVPVPMRDGTILRADVYRPDRGGPYPVLVRRTRYDNYKEFNRFVTAGYIVVSQDVRGCFRSEGTFKGIFTPRELTHDAEDGYDTVEWAARLPDSNGKVGTFGVSYEAYVQWRLAPLRPPSLVAMSACSIMAHFDNEHGGFRPLLLDFYNLLSPEMRRRADRPGVHTRTEASTLWAQGESEKWIHWLPWLDLPREIFEDETETVHYWLKNPHSDPWRHDEGCKDITVPNLDVVGWYDHANGNMLLSQTMFKEAGSEVARKGSRLIIGPWTHALGRRYVGDMDFGSSATLDLTALQIQWFDHWLKGVPNGFANGSPVRLFVMGDNIWRDERCWPLDRTKEKVYFIASDGCANTAGGDGRLIVEEPPSPGTDRYIYDPHDPVPTLGDPLFGVVIRTATDQRPVAKRCDILVYETQPLTERIEVTGFPVVELYAASSQPDTDWFVRLIDVYPDGLALDVSQGFMRARYRKGVDKPELIKPGEVVKYEIRMKPTSNAFLPGHRIRLDITSSDFPNYDRNHNTAADQNSDPELVVAEQTVFHGGARATRIILPWVPGPQQEVGSTKDDDRPQPQRPTFPLHQAATAGDIGQIERLILEGADINLQDTEGEAPLYGAIKAGKAEAVQLLMKVGADINAGKLTPLYAAIDANDIATAKNLIARGANVNPDYFWTPLQQAPYSSNVEIIRLLLDKGADMKAGPWTVWQSAIENNRKDILDLLFQRGLDMNTTEEQHGLSVLGFALAFRKDDMVDYLLARGAKLARGLDRNGLTPLHHVAQMGYKNIDRFGPAIRDAIDERDSMYGFTALHYAARFGQKHVAEVLIANGADVKAKDKWGYQPIHWAAYHDRPEIIELLIAKGADVNLKTSLGQTPLELAIPRRNTKTIEVLRKYSNYMDSDKSYVVLEHDDVRAVIVNNEPVDDQILPGHRGGYSGVASLTHRQRDKNLFVPFYAGLNFEHIHDGTNQPRDILFEPRRAPMQIKRIDEHTAELYQPPTSHWQLESRLWYRLLEDGVIEMTLECIPRARTFKNDYIGLFFASYIDKPESLDIHFLGRPADDSNAESRWIRGVTPEHGTLPTHLAADDNRKFDHDPNFPLTLVFNKSNYRYTEPWYYGVSHGMALVLMFRPEDNVRLSQSPSGAGEGNPAWDFQWFVPQYEVGRKYRFVMRAMYLPFESQQQIIRATAPHLADLERQEWTRFRGPNGQGISDARNIPIKWTEKDYNWKVKLPAAGHGSPVIWNDKVFLTCEDPEPTGGILLALDVSDGRLLWQKKYKLTPYRFHNDNSYATTTPVVDDERVYVLWQTNSEVIMAALDHDGRSIWHRDFPGIYSRFGPGPSPTLFDDLIVFSHENWAKGPEGGKHASSWIALDRETGRTRWTTRRNNAEISYSTPCVYRPDGREPQLIFTSWAHGISGVDPHSGKVIWELDSVLPARAISSPVIAGDLLIGTCGKGGAGKQLSTVRPGSRDNPGQASLVYKCTGKSAPYVPTSLAKDGLLFTFHDQGDVSCLRSETGEVLWSERPGGMFYGSPVWINGLLYCINRKGEVLVLKAAPTYELLAINPLGEKSQATPAVAGGKMYLRTYSHLISIGGISD